MNRKLLVVFPIAALVVALFTVKRATTSAAMGKTTSSFRLIGAC